MRLSHSSVGFKKSGDLQEHITILLKNQGPSHALCAMNERARKFNKIDLLSLSVVNFEIRQCYAITFISTHSIP